MCSNCTGNYENPQDFEQEGPGEDVPDNRASGYIARHDPDAMETYIARDQAAAIIVNVCKNANVPVPNPITMGFAVELTRGLSQFNAEHMLARSLTVKGLDITLLRKQRHEFDEQAA